MHNLNPYNRPNEENEAPDLTKEDAIRIIEQAMHVVFSDEQRAILMEYGVPLLVNACAGSGKTTESIAYMAMLEIYHKVNPAHILSITFSRKASQEIKSRYDLMRKALSQLVYLPKYKQFGNNNNPMFSTFHSFFFNLLKDSQLLVGTTVIDESNMYRIRSALLPLVVSTTADDKITVLDHILQIRGYLLNRNLSADGITTKDDNAALEKLLAQNKIAYSTYVKVITRYIGAKKEQNLIDFDDMQLLLHQYLFEVGGAIRDDLVNTVNEVFDYIVLDEYQDINNIQFENLKALASPLLNRHLLAIGDDDQSIYSFRGADPQYILDFDIIYPNAKVMYLSTNYRCREEILKAIRPSIESNTVRRNKSLLAAKDGGVVTYINADQPAEMATLIDQLNAESVGLAEGTIKLGDVAILVRYNQSRILIGDMLTEYGLPINVNGKSWMLSNNKIYRSLITLITTIRNHDGEGFYQIKGRIARHLRVNAETYLTDTDRDWVQDAYAGKLQFSESTLADIHSIETQTNTEVIVDTAWRMLADYYKYMLDKHYVSRPLFEAIRDYTKELAANTPDYTEFVERESTKREVLKSNLDTKDSLPMYTMHSVKGLEFKRVYIVDASNRCVELIDWDAYKQGVLTSLAKAKAPALMRDWDMNGLTNQQNPYYAYLYRVVNAGGLLSSSMANSTTKSVTEKLEVFQDCIDEAKTAIATVEEERRIFYVACTRAEDTLTISAPSENALPFLAEMTGI